MVRFHSRQTIERSFVLTNSRRATPSCSCPSSPRFHATFSVFGLRGCGEAPVISFETKRFHKPTRATYYLLFALSFSLVFSSPRSLVLYDCHFGSHLPVSIC
ncbi:unnamed protein product [Pylaiella littoralis]